MDKLSQKCTYCCQTYFCLLRVTTNRKADDELLRQPSSVPGLSGLQYRKPATIITYLQDLIPISLSIHKFHFPSPKVPHSTFPNINLATVSCPNHTCGKPESDNSRVPAVNDSSHCHEHRNTHPL
jgi:hypothetical protein